MDEFHSRKITPDQLPKLAEEMYMDPSYVLRVEKMMATDDMVVFAIEHEGGYVGRCSLWLAQADEAEVREALPGVPLVNALEVHPDFYRRGLATMLITTVADEAKQRGRQQLALGVEPQNTPGRTLYEKLGFHYVSLKGKETYVSSWFETQADGSQKMYQIETLLMMKELS